METSHPRRLVRLALTLLASVLVGTAAAAPPPVLIFTFPGCAPTLQGCVAIAPEGSEIRIATNGPIDEALTIERSLQLRAAPGFTPVFTPTSYIFATAVPGADRHLVIQGLRWEPARSTVIRVTHTTEGAFQVELLDNAFVGITGGNPGDMVTVQTYSSAALPDPGPIDLRIAGNVVDIPTDAEASPFFLAFGRALDGTVRIEDNVIRTGGIRQNSAISMYHSGGELALDVARNVIACGTPGQVGGLFVWQTFDTTGRTIARVANNVITGFDGGMMFGASFYASEGTIDLTFVHNTVAWAALRAVQVGGNEDSAEASGIIANNVLVFSERSDVGIHEFGDTVIERRNLVTHIGGVDDAPSAPHPETIVVADPQFVGPDDYRLEPTSLGVNTASLDLLPADVMSDLLRNPRVAGHAPDMGAYELPCAEDSTEPHCVHAPPCEKTGCHSNDPCFPAQCVNDRCVVIEPVGFDTARCACDRTVPASCPATTALDAIMRRRDRACTLLDRAATLAGSGHYYRLVTTARRTFDRAAWRAGRRALSKQIPTACAGDLVRDFTDAEARVSGLLE
jgi:hypothetical protein